MNFIFKILMFFNAINFADPPAAGGGADPKGSDPAPDKDAKIKELESIIAGLKAPKAPGDEDDLLRKTDEARKKTETERDRTKLLESALRFDLNAKEFLKTNESLLPEGFGDVFDQAAKENYADAIEKDQAIKAALVQSFFKVQANVDLLTGAQKAQLDDFMKLTKNGKQDKAQSVFDMIFEPAFEMLKRTKKAEQLSRGHGGGNSTEDAYKKKMLELSKQKYLKRG